MMWIKGRGRIWDGNNTNSGTDRIGIGLGTKICGAAASLSILLAGGAVAADPKPDQSKLCHPAPTVEQKMITDNPSAKVAMRLRGERAQSFIDVLNKLEPITDHKSDMVLIFSKPKASSYFVMVFKGGCLSFGSDIQAQQFRRLWPRITVEGISV
jgi:hypothetical protein